MARLLLITHTVRRPIAVLKLALSVGVLALLCGCVAGVNPIVGYPNGKVEKSLRLLSSSSPTEGETLTRIYEQEIEHNYRLLLSPEGGRSRIPLKSSYRYLIQVGDELKRELTFLRSNARRLSAEHFTRLHFVAGEKWVGYGPCSDAPDENSTLREWETDEEPKRSATATSR